MYTKIDEYGDKYWYLDPELTILHRENKPAIECENRYKCWYINGKRHREDGPAVEYADGGMRWYIDNNLHREDGPAFEALNGYKEYFFKGMYYPNIKTDKGWVKFLRLKNFQ